MSERQRQPGRPQAYLVVEAEYHDAEFVRRRLLDLLAEEERIVTRCTHAFHDAAALEAADFLLTYTSNVFPDDDGREALHRFLWNGGRWLAIHGSAACTRFKPPAVEIGGIRLPGLTDTPDLQPAYMDMLGSRFVSHLAQQPITLRAVSDHPLVRDIQPFTVIDEPYVIELRGAGEVLLESRFTGKAPGYVAGPWLEDVPRAQMVLHRHGAGEVIYLAPGHACGRYDLRPFIDEVPVQRGPWENGSYLEIIRRAIRWGLERETGTSGSGD